MCSGLDVYRTISSGAITTTTTNTASTHNHHRFVCRKKPKRGESKLVSPPTTSLVNTYM